ncbi:MAG: tRNA lysidine(34) synthetase TilS [Bacteroidetes bacterium]|nr:tRNA lysidine(34) synthetase TilS [Bacteroidota bacterium]
MATLNAFAQNAHASGLLTRGQRLLLAISGGIDSMALLHCYATLKTEWALTLTVAHINHQLRSQESDEDEMFVHTQAQKYGLPFVSQRINVREYQRVHRCSLQVAARVLRYQALNAVRQTVGAEWIVTAHHANDNAETVLMNLLRGSGIHGLSGIPVRNVEQRTLRPFLPYSRSEIELYVHDHNIPYRTDSSNASIHYERNFLRTIVIPELERRYNHTIVLTLNSISKLMCNVETQLHSILTPLKEQIVTTTESAIIINLTAWNNIAPFLQDELLYTVLKEVKVEPTEQRIHMLRDLSTRSVGKIVEISSTIRALRDRSTLIIEHTPMDFPPLEVTVGHEYSLPSFTFAAFHETEPPSTVQHSEHCVYIDASKIGNRLLLRPWQHGDWFIPLGMQYPKKVSDYFIDIKLPRFEKKGVPILESNGSIVWVCGKRLDDRFKVTPNTQQFIKLIYQPKRNTHGTTTHN